MDFSVYLDPALAILVPVLYTVGIFLKKSSISDWKIPIVLGVVSIALSCIYLFSATSIASVSDVAGILFAGLTQGVLYAAASVYAHNIYKQTKKRNKTEETAESEG